MPHHAASYGEIISLWLRYGDYGDDGTVGDYGFAMETMETMATTER
ncbi:MAG: hypothetical protein PHO44_01810 [Sphaerochaetaceae bacterium]|nr:hypothetical protein [Sphaerochaetaceae bacterium]MDD4006694.1 hypothetical protein [Sphaerochaetaceae bacterium]MDD4396357.1 hypothetical protein [Sphaerochaetaceae bacterium]